MLAKGSDREHFIGLLEMEICILQDPLYLRTQVLLGIPEALFVVRLFTCTIFQDESNLPNT
jgi:hypothetical protein